MPRTPVIAALVIAAAVAGCSSAAPSAAPSPTSAAPSATASAASLGCAWYSPTATPGQVVNVTATGAACRGGSLVGWLVAHSDRRWTSESVIPGSYGTLLATLKRAGSTVDVWFTGPAETPVASPVTPGATLAAGSAAALAGRIADALEAAGWAPSR